MKTVAAVLVETGKPLELEELEIPLLKAGQVIVEVIATGVCHTQLSEARGHRGKDAFLPHCMGHEGSGIVREIGSGVSKVKVGDRVILSWIKGSGADVPGTVYRSGSKSVNAGGITTFQQYSVISENRLTVIPQQISFEAASLIGCALPTGFGAVFNTAQVRPGQSVAVFGVGGVGLCAIAAARIAGCAPIFAVDRLGDRLEVAKQLGATHVVLASGDLSPVAEIVRSNSGGVDISVEASGHPSVMSQALEVVRQQGGIAVLIGNARFEEKLSLDPRQFNQGKQLRGTWGGDNLPDRDFPRYAKFIESGRFDTSIFTQRRYRLEQINNALDDLEYGRVTRPLISFEHA